MRNISLRREQQVNSISKVSHFFLLVHKSSFIIIVDIIIIIFIIIVKSVDKRETICQVFYW